MEILYAVTAVGITTLIGATALVIRNERAGNAARFEAWQERQVSPSAIEQVDPEQVDPERAATEAGAR